MTPEMKRKLMDGRAAKGTRTPKAVLHTVRTRGGGKKTLKLTRGLAIKLLCMECLGWEQSPADCTSQFCPVYPFRGTTMASQRADVAQQKGKS